MKAWYGITVLIAASLLIAPVTAQSPFAPKVTGPLSQRVVAYVIDAKFDPGKHSIDATETLTYHNLTGRPLDRFPFHLYLNGFQPKATWVREAHRDRASDFEEGWKPEDIGSNDVTSLEVAGMGDLTKQIKFIAPDDGNADDKTVFEVQLPRPVPPGQDVVFKMKFHAVFPEVVARTGYKRTFLLAAQWFPKVGVWWHGAWNCHQFHAMTEFFGDFGTYDVKITLPKNYIIGATGVQTGANDNPDGTRTVAFHAEDVHDFAWTADPNFKVVDSEFNGSVGAVKIRLLTYTGHKSSWDRYISIMQQTMKRFDDWYGPYPYAQITVVDPPHGAVVAGGMEYPTFITGDTTWWAPKGQHLFPEFVTEHEFGHQYWYAMVATNEFENAWLDEGINSYSDAKVTDDLYGRDASVINMLGAQLGEPALQREQYLNRPDFDPLSRPSYLDVSWGTYGAISYGKTASMLLTLETVIGEKALRDALHNYFMKYRFTHPTQEDFLRVVNETVQQDLGWYWQQAVYGTQLLDYEVLRADSTPVNWYDPKLEEKQGETEYETQILLHRKGDFVFPVEAEIKFDNGGSTRVRWDGRERWVRYVYIKKAQVVSAQIDPDYRVTMDRNSLNNSHTDATQHLAVAKLTTYWTFFTQFLGQMLGWLT